MIPNMEIEPVKMNNNKIQKLPRKNLIRAPTYKQQRFFPSRWQSCLPAMRGSFVSGIANPLRLPNPEMLAMNDNEGLAMDRRDFAKKHSADYYKTYMAIYRQRVNQDQQRRDQALKEF